MTGIVDEWARGLGIFESAELVNVPDIVDLRQSISQAIEVLWREKIGDFGLSMAGKYRSQGMMEFVKELNILLGDGEDKSSDNVACANPEVKSGG